MKSSISLLTLLSVSLVVAAPTPFSVKGPVVTPDTANIVTPITNFGRREAAIVEDIGKRALQLRSELLAASNGQDMNKDNGNAGAQGQGEEKAKNANNNQGART
ncbi:hypothetical protein BDW02DRAFT_595685 [Decorospora gaudefroyi]|uniref:Uncharacterized protein n=1 Tax=Decorospora gaudefroyi TaxID=184978 RepID=A0A6A5KQK4_9PLEO|nr:hypothetical protein BDW02DRAFT_595685 [Decorospora gaudefroyi]